MIRAVIREKLEKVELRAGAAAAPRYNRNVIAADIVARLRARLTAALAPPSRDYRVLVVGGRPVGRLDAMRAARICGFSTVFRERGEALEFAPGLDTPEARTEALAPVTRTLAAEGALTAWRDERYAAGAAPGAAPAFLIERAAARYFGVHTYAAHVNGLVADGGEMAMWVARRSATKAIDPGQLDNLVGGGIAAGSGVRATVVKEAREEASVPADVAQTALPCGAVHICREQPDGLQLETIFVHDLMLPAAFVPAGEDGEVAEHRRVPLAEAARLAASDAAGEIVTADASLVIADCLIRHGALAPDSPHFLALEALRHPSLPPRIMALS
jgi:8-oxo-dGTP pyrophosphatase MutT (NUDIX family)